MKSLKVSRSRSQAGSKRTTTVRVHDGRNSKSVKIARHKQSLTNK